MSIVRIRDLSVRYGDIVALDGVNLDIQESDFLGIIGPNGAGKSTLFSCMLGLVTRYTGSIEFFGHNIRDSGPFPGGIGYVPQRPVFESNFPATVREVVRMGLAGSDGGRVDRTLQDVWLHELGNRRIGELSGGQLQRVFIAKALVSGPRLLILDEPVTGIDPQSTELFYGILRELHRRKITIIWSSHDMDAVRRLANRLACLNRTLFFHGEPGEFFENDELVRKYSEASMQEHMHRH